MKATIEQVDELRKRANVGYKEAKEALEMFDGDLVDALAYLDEQKKTKEDCCHGKSFMNTVHAIIKKGNATFMKITKNDNTVLNLPLTIVVPAAVLLPPVMITALIIAILTGCKIKFKSAKGDDCCVNKHIEKVTDIVSNATQKFEQELSK